MAADPLTLSTIDDIFNDNISDFDDDPFLEKPSARDTRDDKAVLSPRSGMKRKLGDNDKENDGLGLDEEVKIVKKRKPIAKLDEARLMSEPGIPKLRAITRSNQLYKKLRIKGKGHEFTDAARLLNHFQLWLDNLYPRAKFADALQLVEKAGHSKRMHMMRSEWINEGKPGYRVNQAVDGSLAQKRDPDLFGTGSAHISGSTPVSTDKNASQSIFGTGVDDDALFIPDANRSNDDEDDGPGDDELEALLAMQDTLDARAEPSNPQTNRDESEGEDDLDALLAEQDARTVRPSGQVWSWNRVQPPTENEDEDDLDALLAEQEARTTQPISTINPIDSTSTHKLDEKSIPNPEVTYPIDDEGEEDDDDLEALLALNRTKSKPSTIQPESTLPTPQHTSSPPKPSSPTYALPEHDHYRVPDLFTRTYSSSPIPNNPEDVDLDDLDALLASQEAKETGTAGAQNGRDSPRTPRARKVRDAMDILLSSSPVPNEESQ